MAEEKKKIKALGRVITKNTHEKVANMVDTFLTDESYGLQISFIKTEPEKVTNMVGTFLTDDSYGFQISDRKKVASTVATFFDRRYQFP